jgi:hypothetical protein
VTKEHVNTSASEHGVVVDASSFAEEAGDRQISNVSTEATESDDRRSASRAHAEAAACASPTEESEAQVISSQPQQSSWAEPGETLLLVDWDDTLFPTTSMDMAHLWRISEDPEQLNELYDTVADFLRTAATVSHVAILSMAIPSWIETCIRNNMPGLHGLLDELGIDTVLAREDATRNTKLQAHGDCRDPSQFLKTKAMKRTINKFYKKRSWKNVISIGDSQAERLALQDVVIQHRQRDSTGRCEDCLCKTLTLISSPCLAELIQELKAVSNQLATLVHCPNDLDITMNASDMTLRGEGLQGS